MSSGNLLSNIAPPSALPSFIANPISTTTTTTTSQKKTDEINSQADYPGVQTKQPQDNQSQQPTDSSEPSTSTTTPLLPPPPPQDSPFFDAGLVGSGIFSWVKTNVVNSNVLSKVAEKAKSSVNTMITTLDPQMREFICKCNLHQSSFSLSTFHHFTPQFIINTKNTFFYFLLLENFA